MNETRELSSISSWLRQSARPLVISHRRPDGDALGSMVAMACALQQMGQQPHLAIYEPLPPRYLEILGGNPPLQVWADTRDVLESNCDGVIIVDTCALAQLEPITEFLARAPRTCVIDHHATRDPIGIRDDDLRYFDESASAAALIVEAWIRDAQLEITPTIANALFLGIASDTGWFRFSNTDARTMEAGARLVAAGVDPGAMFRALNQQDPVEKLRLVARVLNQLEMHADGRIAVLKLRAADFEATGADESMTDDLVNEATRLGSTELTLLFTEEDENTVRVNLRSKQTLDVSEFARRFGGGGHPRAAGARLRGNWDQVVPRMIADAVALV